MAFIMSVWCMVQTGGFCQISRCCALLFCVFIRLYVGERAYYDQHKIEDTHKLGWVMLVLSQSPLGTFL